MNEGGIIRNTIFATAHKSCQLPLKLAIRRLCSACHSTRENKTYKACSIADLYLPSSPQLQFHLLRICS